MKQDEKLNESSELRNNDISESGSWRPRPNTKTKFNVSKIISVVVVCIIVLGLISYYFLPGAPFFGLHSSNQVATPTEGAIEKEEPPIVVGEYNDSNEIKILKQEALALFGEQIQAYFFQDPEVETKINDFENKMNEIVQAIYEYYVTNKNGGWEKAEFSFIDFLQKLDYEGVRLKQSSVPYYLDRLKALEDNNEE